MLIGIADRYFDLLLLADRYLLIADADRYFDLFNLWLIGILIFLTYEFKIVLALASCNYFDKLLLENRHHFLRMKIPNYLKMDTIIRLRQ